MDKVLTEELLEELLNRPKVDDFLNSNNLEQARFSDCLNTFMRDKGMSRKEIIHRTNINETHAYQMFSGERGASRDKVLQLAVAMDLDLRETNRLLHSAGVSSLYCKDRRDAIIIFCIENSYNLQQIDEELHKFHESTISPAN